MRERFVDARDRRNASNLQPAGEIGDCLNLEGPVLVVDRATIEAGRLDDPRNTVRPVPSAARPSRTAGRMLFSFIGVSKRVRKSSSISASIRARPIKRIFVRLRRFFNMPRAGSPTPPRASRSASGWSRSNRQACKSGPSGAGLLPRPSHRASGGAYRGRG
jgi:hypothetical protein